MSFLLTHAHSSGAAKTPRAGVFSPPLEASPLGEGVKAVAVFAPVGGALGAARAWWFKYPLADGLRAVGSQAVAAGGIAAIYAATNTLAAHVRHKDDDWNAPFAGFAAGLAAGARAGSLQKMIFFSAAFSGLALWGKFFSTQLKDNFYLDKYEKRDQKPPVFVGNARDQYKERWAAIQAREADSE